MSNKTLSFNRNEYFNYYRVTFKLLTPLLATCTKTSIYHKHVIDTAKKEMEKVNKLGVKVTKALEKYKGSELSEKKEIQELQAVLRTYCQIMGKIINIPSTVEEILILAKELEEEFNTRVDDDNLVDCDVFLRDENGRAMISTHMILGNLKENAKIMCNNGDKTVFKYKSTISESTALDVKPIEQFVTLSKDVWTVKNPNEVQLPCAKGKWIVEKDGRVLLERPIRCETIQGPRISIKCSEVIEEGATFAITLRVRKDSPFTSQVLGHLLSMGINNGLGAWRGSGNFGSYIFKLEELADYQETFDDIAA